MSSAAQESANDIGSDAGGVLVIDPTQRAALFPGVEGLIVSVVS